MTWRPRGNTLLPVIDSTTGTRFHMEKSKAQEKEKLSLGFLLATIVISNLGFFLFVAPYT